MPVITLKDGTKGYKYPTASKTYTPTKTPFVGTVIWSTPRRGYQAKEGREVIIREAAGTYNRPDKNGGGYYWVAPLLPDGSIGPMTTRYVYAESLQESQS